MCVFSTYELTAKSKYWLRFGFTMNDENDENDECFFFLFLFLVKRYDSFHWRCSAMFYMRNPKILYARAHIDSRALYGWRQKECRNVWKKGENRKKVPRRFRFFAFYCPYNSITITCIVRRHVNSWGFYFSSIRIDARILDCRCCCYFCSFVRTYINMGLCFVIHFSAHNNNNSSRQRREANANRMTIECSVLGFSLFSSSPNFFCA